MTVGEADARCETETQGCAAGSMRRARGAGAVIIHDTLPLKLSIILRVILRSLRCRLRVDLEYAELPNCKCHHATGQAFRHVDGGVACS